MQPKPCTHHWHNTGTVKLSNPPSYEQVCCHCGEMRDYTPPPPMPYNYYLPPPCGPHKPDTTHVFIPVATE